LSDIMLSTGLPTLVPTPREPEPSPEAIKPIETRYAGHRFRSRLEARWAVFFDHLGIEWQYEPECFKIAGKGYLPDFWLPGLCTWVEVKGVLDQATLNHLIQAINPLCGLPRDPGGTRWKPSRKTGRILLLGEIPKVKFSAWCHSRLDFINGDPCVVDVVFRHDGQTASLSPIGDAEALLSENGMPQWDTDADRRSLLAGGEAWTAIADPPIDSGYNAARMARFEHGESGYAGDPPAKPKRARKAPAKKLVPQSPGIGLADPSPRADSIGQPTTPMYVGPPFDPAPVPRERRPRR